MIEWGRYGWGWLSGEAYKTNYQTSLRTRGTRLSPDPSKSCGCCLASILRCSLVICSIIYCCISRAFMLWYFIITRSTITIDPKIMPPNIAFLKATLAPERKASRPPVTAPATIWLKAPSSLRMAMRLQSVMEKSPAQSAKLPEWLRVYLLGWVLFFWGGWFLPWFFPVWVRTMLLWWSRVWRRLHIPWRIRCRSHLRSCRDRVVIA